MRWAKLKSRYGMTQEEYWALFAQQGGSCAICLRPPKDERFLDVDHDHETEVVRGLLCASCNTAIGSLREDPILFERAVHYLTKGNIGTP